MNWQHKIIGCAVAMVALAALSAAPARGQEKQAQELPDYWQQDWDMKPTPRRGPNEGGGPYDRFVIWGATVIDGTGAPPYGPMNIVVEGDNIVDIERANPKKRPEKADRVIDARGMYVTPGFIDTHDHIGGKKIDYDASYTYKLWLGHGITTVKGVPFGDLEWSLKQQELSAEHKIVAPRLIVCTNPGAGDEWKDREANTPKAIRDWVEYAKDKGVQCLGEIGARDPAIMAALMSAANKAGIETMDHLDQKGVARMTAADAVKLGLDEVTHFYGIFESMLDKHTIQDWPLDYNYYNEYDRFSRVARLWNQSAKPESKQWQDLIKLFLSHDTILSPTMTIYLAGRDPMAARNRDWHEEYTLPSLWKYFQPNPENHGSYFYNWTSADEAAWHKFYIKWQQFLYDYNQAGGRITVGEDTSFIYQLAGFGYIQELKLLQEAGLTPFEILRSATLYGAESIFEPDEPNGEPIKYGVIREGKKADLLVFTHNPLKDFNLLYGTGALRLDKKTGKTHRVRALKYTIADGIVYDSQKLLGDVRHMVDEAERKAGWKVNIPVLSPPEAGSSM